MTDPQPDRLAALRELAETLDGPGQLALVSAVLEVVEQDTALVLDQTHAAQDIAARTKAGAWIGNTELAEILDDAVHFLKRYKQQREALGRIREALQARIDGDSRQAASQPGADSVG